MAGASSEPAGQKKTSSPQTEKACGKQHTSPAFVLPVLVEEPGAIASPTLDGSTLQIGLVYARHGGDQVVDPLLLACRGELMLKGVPRTNIHELAVMRPFAMPYAVKHLVSSKSPLRLDAVVCLGCLPAEETHAYPFQAEAVTRGIMKMALKCKTPIIDGVLLCNDFTCARKCVGLEGGTAGNVASNLGVEWAQSAIEMAHLNRQMAQEMVAHCGCACHSECHGGGHGHHHGHCVGETGQGSRRDPEKESKSVDVSSLPSPFPPPTADTNVLGAFSEEHAPELPVAELKDDSSDVLKDEEEEENRKEKPKRESAA